MGFRACGQDVRNRVDDGFKASQDVPRGCIEDHLRAWRQVLQSLIRIGHHQPACSAGKIIGTLREAGLIMGIKAPYPVKVPMKRGPGKPRHPSAKTTSSLLLSP